MSNFIAHDYENIVADIVNDTFYIESSNRGKIATIRQYSEVFVRQILGAEPKDKFMLGNTKNELKERSQFVSHAVCVIQSYGNDATHTQHLQRFEDDDLETVVDALFDLIAYLFIVFFKKYPINYDTDPALLHDFSLLPPIIRYKTLNQLFQSEPENINIIDRLALSIVKTYGQEDAFDWLESNRTSFEALPYPDEEQINILIEQIGLEKAQAIPMCCDFKNVYELCEDKIRRVGNVINKRGALYTKFEQAKKYYEEYHSEGTSDETQKLHSIIDLVYLGRKIQD